MKYILIIGDGMADVPVPELDGKTPLQYARTPTMDRLASAGVVGNAITVPQGMPAGSDTAILSIFGCDPKVHYGGRAPLEAAAVGISLSPGEVAYRCNMVTIESALAVDSTAKRSCGSDKLTADNAVPPADRMMSYEKKKLLSHSAGAIEGHVSDALIRELFENPGVKDITEKAGIRIFPGSSFRHIAVQSAKGSKDYSGGKHTGEGKAGNHYIVLTPPHDHLGETIGQHLPRGGDNAETLTNLMCIAHEVLDKHPINIERCSKGLLPANGIWFWANGTAIALPGFTERYGKTGSVISAVPLCQGIGVLMGLEKISVDGATGELNTNYEGKADAAFESLKRHDFTTVHIEAPDECTHNGDTKGKVQAIEWIDLRVLKRLTKRLAESAIDYKMLVMADHRTLSTTRGHDGGPVPFILYDSRYDRKTGLRFCEDEAKKGEFITDGTRLMELLFK